MAEAMFDSRGASEDWWESVPPQKACTRFRMVFPDDHRTVPRDLAVCLEVAEQGVRFVLIKKFRVVSQPAEMGASSIQLTNNTMKPRAMLVNTRVVDV